VTASGDSAAPLVAMRGIVKRFGSIVADDHVDLDIRAGEVLALLGENGAGKSTLMRVLYGLYAADAGTIAIGGRVVAFASPLDAMAAGIGMVFQQFSLIPALTVLETCSSPRRARRGGSRGGAGKCSPRCGGSSAWRRASMRDAASKIFPWASARWSSLPRCSISIPAWSSSTSRPPS